jgi:cell division protein FtsZ
LITVPALINLDFADVRAVMSEGGAALMAVGRAGGDDRARRAAEEAISSRLLDVTIDGARGILFNITGGADFTLFEANEAAAIVRDSAHPEVNLIFGAQIDESLGDEVRVTVIATGFEQSRVARRPDVMQPVMRSAPQQQQRQPMQQPPQQPRPQSQYAAPPPASQPEDPIPAPPPPKPAPRTYEDNGDLDIPTFLRKRK